MGFEELTPDGGPVGGILTGRTSPDLSAPEEPPASSRRSLIPMRIRSRNWSGTS